MGPILLVKKSHCVPSQETEDGHPFCSYSIQTLHGTAIGLPIRPGVVDWGSIDRHSRYMAVPESSCLGRCVWFHARCLCRPWVLRGRWFQVVSAGPRRNEGRLCTGETTARGRQVSPWQTCRLRGSGRHPRSGHQVEAGRQGQGRRSGRTHLLPEPHSPHQSGCFHYEATMKQL